MVETRRVDARGLSRVVRNALSVALILSVTPRFAAAEVFDPLRGYGFDGSPIARPQPDRAQPSRLQQDRRAAPADQAQTPEPRRRAAPAYVSTSTVRRMASREGFRLVDLPKRRGRAFIATAQDEKGRRFRLIFNAYNGQVVDRMDLGVADAKPPTLTIPTAPTAVAAPASVVVAKPDTVSRPTATEATSAAIATPVVAPLVIAAVPLVTAPIASAVPAAPASASPVIPTPASPPTTYAAVNPCEVPQHTSLAAAPRPVEAPNGTPPKSSVAAIPAPTIIDKATDEPTFDMTNAHSPPEPYSAPTPVYADGPPESPAMTAAIPAETLNAQSPPEPYSAPTPVYADQATTTESQPTQSGEIPRADGPKLDTPTLTTPGEQSGETGPKP